MALKQLINWFGGSFDVEFIQIGHLVVDKMQVTHLKHLLLTPKNRLKVNLTAVFKEKMFRDI